MKAHRRWQGSTAGRARARRYEPQRKAASRTPTALSLQAGPDASIWTVTTIKQTSLPGVGIRYELELESGPSIAVLAHRTGRRDLFVYSERDPDAVETELEFTPEEGTVVADLLGGSLVESLQQLQQRVEGLAIDWIGVPTTSPFAGRTIADGQIRTRTGVSIVAVIRGTEAYPAPAPDFRFEGGDTAVVVGTPESIAAAASLLTRS
ncbi:MAG: cation:proton antiporter regulatory subunit [Actinomycetota bacterium]|nr:cation:proton antiporter regulatory subunit [Actinomycetota bacterium]